MIDIKVKKDCCGCSACVQICPKGCISLIEDNEGFLYPEADKSICIECGLCDKVCPFINVGIPCEPADTYAAKNKDEHIRMESSSGGIFTLLAEKVIREGGRQYIQTGRNISETRPKSHVYRNAMPDKGTEIILEEGLR